MSVECKWHHLGLSKICNQDGEVIPILRYGGHLGMVLTWVWCSPGCEGHLGMVVTLGEYHTQITIYSISSGFCSFMCKSSYTIPGLEPAAVAVTQALIV